ncbi:TetR family transcriptional regulator [Actinorhabdospora filicis]|uniref:TetR family transcriptional regulator n=1 Tax=Actinorhabdospora filicis TaxID=1785913 RepID=A0A9W6SIF6_9ACTN|nr:TetR/AcrR family transcriptional regulator C-terminal domain-containing protein [Actinorhabdospora filicis]GLZ76557.1 TetR family transcriptional regulator [Actinorhabdospora filicis]
MPAKPRLTREAMVAAAMRLLDEVGLDGLTVRRLAEELGVRSPALYWHVKTKRELLDAVAEELILAGGMGPPAAGETWRDWLGRRARGYRAALLAHRDGARIVAQARSVSPATVRFFDTELAALTGFGFTPAVALRTIAALTYYVHGSVLQEQAAVSAPPVGVEPGETLARAVREGASTVGEATFEHGLAAMLAGMGPGQVSA